MKYLKTKAARIVFRGVLSIMFLIVGEKVYSKAFLIDHKIASVNGLPIWKSDLDTALIQHEAQTRKTSDEKTKRQVLTNLILFKLFISNANVDIDTDEQNIDLMVKDRINQMVSQTGSKENLEKATKMPMRELKRVLRKNMKDQYIYHSIQKELSENIKINTAELLEFEKTLTKKEKMQEPPTVVLKRLVKHPIVVEEERKAIIKKLKMIRGKLKTQSFETLAAEYSEDQLTKDKGGDIGFFWSRGDLFKEYEEAVLDLKPVEEGKNYDKYTSQPVETRLGFYIIQLVGRQGKDYRTRHILIKPKKYEDQVASTIHEMSKIKWQIISGKTTFDEQYDKLRAKTDDHKLSGYYRIGDRIRLNLDEVPALLPKDLLNHPEGTIFGPFTTKISEEAKIVELIMLVQKYPAHQTNVEFNSDELTLRLQQKLRSKKIDDWIKEKLKSADITLEKSYKKEELLKEFMDK